MSRGERAGHLAGGRERRNRAERGSAMVEFVFLTVLVLVPTIYLIATLAQLQAAAFAVEAGAREAGRVLATARSGTDAEGRARTAVALAAQDQGLAEPAVMALTCSASPCLSPGARIEVHVESEVPLPLVPDAVAAALGASVRVHSTQQIHLDEYAQVGP